MIVWRFIAAHAAVAAGLALAAAWLVLPDPVAGQAAAVNAAFWFGREIWDNWPDATAPFTRPQVVLEWLAPALVFPAALAALAPQ